MFLVGSHGRLEGKLTLRLQLFRPQELDVLPADAEYTQLGEFRNSMSGRTLAFNVLAASAIKQGKKAPAVGTKCRGCGTSAMIDCVPRVLAINSWQRRFTVPSVATHCVRVASQWRTVAASRGQRRPSERAWRGDVAISR